MRINRTHKSLPLLLILVCSLFASCGLFKKTCANQAVLTEIPNDAAKKMANNAFDFKHLTLKAKAVYSAPNQKQSFSMSIKMKKDTAIWVSISGFGFEVMRVLIESDSVRLMNKLNKTYTVKGIEDLRSLVNFDVTLSQLQNLLVGNSPYIATDYSLYQGENKMLFKKEAFIKSLLELTESFRVSQNSLIQDGQSDSLIISYSEFQNLKKEGCIPGLLNAEYAAAETSLSLQYNSVSTATIDRLPFNVPPSYKRGH